MTGECDCKSRHGWSGFPCSAQCGDYLCMKPEGHDGPHSACACGKHPVKVWESDASGKIKEAVRTSLSWLEEIQMTGRYHVEDTGFVEKAAEAELNGQKGFLIAEDLHESSWAFVPDEQSRFLIDLEEER